MILPCWTVRGKVKVDSDRGLLADGENAWSRQMARCASGLMGMRPDAWGSDWTRGRAGAQH